MVQGKGGVLPFPWPFYEQIKKYSNYFGLEPAMVAAVCEVESGFNPYAARYEAGFHHRYVKPWLKQGRRASLFEEAALATSLGIMQVMGLVAVELGCEVRSLPSLVTVETGLWFGCRKLRQIVRRYGQDASSDIFAAYNAGSVRWLDVDRDGRKDPDEPYRNQRYVDTCLKYYSLFKELS